MMPTPQNGQNPKHIKSFWPIFIIIIVAVIAAGIIWFFAYNNKLQDDIDSSGFWSSFHHSKTPAQSHTGTVVKKSVAK